jgi:hypothetical protein
MQCGGCQKTMQKGDPFRGCKTCSEYYCAACAATPSAEKERDESSFFGSSLLGKSSGDSLESASASSSPRTAAATPLLTHVDDDRRASGPCSVSFKVALRDHSVRSFGAAAQTTFLVATAAALGVPAAQVSSYVCITYELGVGCVAT